MPTLQQLRYLVALADTLNFSRAAARLNVTQPTLSAQIRALEARLGAPLFERNRARVLPTATGAEIARRARLVLREVDTIRGIARGGDRGRLDGVLRLGVVHTVGAYLLSVAMPLLREEFPGLRLYVREDRPERLLAQLADGVQDALVLPEEPARADFESAGLLRESLLVVLPADHPLAGKPMIDPSDLAGEVVLTMESWHRLHDQIADLCRETGARLARDYEGTTLDTVRQMVATGMGIALLPALYVRSEVMRETLVVARPLSRGAPSRDIAMVWRRANPLREHYLGLARTMREAVAEFDTPA